jgi:TolB-like protein/Tfp pilus assembly protein PilF
VSVVDPVSLFGELKRRRVIRALIGYGIAAFAVLQIAEPIIHGLHWPEATLSYVVAALAIGFPIVVSLAWIFDVSERGVQRAAPAAEVRGPRLALILIGIGVLAAAPGTVWYFVVRGIAKPAPQHASSRNPQPSVAVLPFTDLSPEKNQGYFSDGVAEEILNALAQVEGLRVAGRTSSFYFKGRNDDLATIADKLHVAHLLEGSVRKSGNRVRITAQLINAKDGFHVWSNQYDRELIDIFKVQAELATAVVEALKIKLLPGVNVASKVHRARDPEAYRLTLLGRALMLQQTEEGGRRAEEVLEKAVALEPTYAPAWQRLATLRGNAALDADRGHIQARVRDALDAAERAVAAEPEYEGGYAVRGWIRSQFLWDWKGARNDLQRAVSLNESEISLHHYATFLQKMGLLKEAIDTQRKALDRDPLNVFAWTNLAAYLTDDGQFEAARAALTRSLEISPNNLHSSEELAIIDLLQAHPAQALTRIEKMPREIDRLVGLAIAHHELGHAREANEALSTLAAKADGAQGDVAYSLATVHAWRGERDKAFEWLDRAYARHDLRLRWLKVDSLLRNLRGDPRYVTLLKKMNLPTD